MNSSTHIRYCTHRQIDKKKWDHCIHNAGNGLIYANSFYLDGMAEYWDALILNDYEAVMPLTWNKKWGIRYLYQPPFTPQLGIFGRTPLAAETIYAFMQECRKHFRFGEIFFNHSNAVEGFTSEHCNLVVPLYDSFENIAARFKPYLRKNLTRAKKYNLKYSSSTDIDKSVRLYAESYGKAIASIKQAYFKRFVEVCRQAAGQGQVVIRQVHGPNEELLAMNLVLKDHRRLYNLISTTVPNGRTMEANHVLMYELIREFAGQPLILDMEGSDLNGIAWFYRKFGAIDEPYYFLRFNRLPFWVRWMKPG